MERAGFPAVRPAIAETRVAIRTSKTRLQIIAPQLSSLNDLNTIRQVHPNFVFLSRPLSLMLRGAAQFLPIPKGDHTLFSPRFFSFFLSLARNRA